MDTRLGADTAHSDARPALARARDTRRQVGQPRGTPRQMVSSPRPAGSLRQTGRYVRVALPPPPCRHDVTLPMDLPAPPVVGMPLDGPDNANNIDVALRPFEAGESRRPDVLPSPLRKVHAAHIQVGPVGGAGQGQEADTRVHTLVGRAVHALGPPHGQAARETVRLMSPPLHRPERNTHPAVVRGLEETNVAETVDTGLVVAGHVMARRPPRPGDVVKVRP